MRLLEAYSGFFLLPSKFAALLLLAATFVDPATGAAGLLAGLSAMVSCSWLDLPNREDRLELVNAVLLGLLIGATYQFSFSWTILVLACGPGAVICTKLCTGILGKRPLLCAPFALLGLFMLSLGATLYMPLAKPGPEIMTAGNSSAHLFLKSLGSIYLSPYSLSGLFILLALAISCRYLTALALAGFVASEMVMAGFGVTLEGTRMIGATGGILCALILGGLLVAPRFSSLVLAFFSAASASALYLALLGPMARLGFPPLAWPFMLVTWVAVASLGHHRSLDWHHAPALPTDSAESLVINRARGLCPRSLAVRAPFEGAWEVYQSVDGPHTHQGPWRHAIDFIISRDGKSYRNKGVNLNDYYCFGESLYSPVKGTVVSIQDSIQDNRPGKVNIRQRFGNHVLLAVARDRYLLLAHLKKNSVQVSVGQTVEVGTPLGQCGNSGRSPQPHLHMHVQKSVELGSATVPFHLSGVKENNHFSLNSMPEEGSLVERPSYQESLRQALDFQVGRRLIFLVERSGLSELETLEVKLDLQGRFWLSSRSGAKVGLYQDARLLTCYDRDQQADELLDLFTLALGVTPFCEEPGEWTDRPPARLLPGKFWNLSSCGYSRYRRQQYKSGGWIQLGLHSQKCQGAVMETRARFNLQRGLRELSLHKGDQTLLSARLVGVGMNSDLGAPGWEVGVEETGGLASAATTR